MSDQITSPPAAATGSSSHPSGTDPSSIRDLKPAIKNVDMSEEMQSETIEIAYDALEKFTVEKDMAGHVKRTMDSKFGPTWHAVVGQRYGSYVTHETKHFIYFYLGQMAFLLWRA
ncbi:probable Dynein light chain 1, cytoplasmic [Ustilago sp. UG-2017b]|nr:probable Dynein light chain 1, cytoplasmic [Ustilago sp. UG-2017b]